MLVWSRLCISILICVGLLCTSLVQSVQIWSSPVQSSPDGLSSGSLADFSAEVDHLDLEDFWNILLLSERHRSPEELEGDDHCHVLKNSRPRNASDPKPLLKQCVVVGVVMLSCRGEATHQLR